jgi:hypothetical protein
MSDGREPRFISVLGDMGRLSLAGARGTGRIAGEAEGPRPESPEISRRFSLVGGRGTGRMAGAAEGPRPATSDVSVREIREFGIPIRPSPSERLFSGGRGTKWIAPECDSRISGAPAALGGLETPCVAIAAPAVLLGLSPLSSLNGGLGM